MRAPVLLVVAAMLGCGAGGSGGDAGATDGGSHDAAPDRTSADTGADQTSTDAGADQTSAEAAAPETGANGPLDSSQGGPEAATPDGAADAPADAAGSANEAGTDAAVDAAGGAEAGALCTAPAPTSTLCTASCPAGQSVAEDGCGVGDWTLGCTGGYVPEPVFAEPYAYGCKYRNAATASCAPGCVLGLCDTGYADCDGNQSNGCEASLESTANCGSCGHACAPGQLCSAGSCVTSCAAPLTACGEACADTTSDNQNCGACGTSCALASSPPFLTETTGVVSTCTAGKCGTACAPGFTGSGDACFDTQNDPNDCGSVGACPVPTNGRALCVAGQCVGSCQPGWILSGSACSPPATTTQWLATGLSAPEDLAVDATGVYWTDPTGGTVDVVPLAGGAVRVVASGQAHPWRVALDASDVYWTNSGDGTVMHAPKDGSAAPSVLATGLQPGPITVLGGQVYWFNMAAPDGGSYSGQSVPVDGGTPGTFITGGVGSGQDFSADCSHAVFQMVTGPLGLPLSDFNYWALDGNGVHQLQSTSGGMGNWVALGASRIYIYDFMAQEIQIYDETTLAMVGIIPEAEASGLPPFPAASPVNGTGDACAMYYVSSSGIEMFVRGTTFPALIVPSKTVHRIAAYGGHVYWTDTTNAIGDVAVP